MPYLIRAKVGPGGYFLLFSEKFHNLESAIMCANGEILRGWVCAEVFLKDAKNNEYILYRAERF